MLDLYAGVGLFARFLADAVGPAGRVVAVEGDRGACAHAAANLPGAAVASPGAVDRGARGGVRRAASTWSSSTRRARAPA